MAVEKIRYKDLLDYAERLTFSGNEAKVERGEFLMNLMAQIDASRAEKGTTAELLLAKDEIEFVMDRGFKTEPFWAFLKSGKVPEYGSPLTDYQDAYVQYMTNPMSQRDESFAELKNAEQIIRELHDTGYLKHMALARGEADLSKLPKSNFFADIPYIKQMAYGRNGLKGQLDEVYADLSTKHNPVLVEQLRALEQLAARTDISTNDAKLYATAEFKTNKDGKEELHYTIKAPILEKSRIGEFKTKDNEAITIKVTDKGIEGAKYIDSNLYFDDLIVQVPKPNGNGTIEKTGKPAANYLKEHPTEDYPDPNQIQQVKVDGKLQWVYILPDMSYPEKGAAEPFTKDFAGINSSIVSNRLKEVSKGVEQMFIEQEKSRELKSWAPQKSAERNKDNCREAVR